MAAAMSMRRYAKCGISGLRQAIPTGPHAVLIRPSSRPRFADLLTTPAGSRGIIYLPTILQPSFWKGLVPSFLRRRDPDAPVGKKKGWNPATFYIWMFLLIGSQAIQLLGLKGAYAKFSQETDAKLELLRDVVRRIQNGEKVDVERVLGTGDEKKEREWEDVMKELEAEDAMFRERRKKWKQRKVENQQDTPPEK